MGIYVDGERSRQRLGFAKSLLNKIKMLGQKSKTLIYDGFLYQVKNIAPGLDKIAVTAPMGAVVLCSSEYGIKVFTADHWLSALSGGRDIYVVNITATPPYLWFQTVSNAAQPNVKFAPEATQYLLGSDYYTGSNPTPAISFFGGEFYWLTVVGNPAVSAKRLSETFLNSYSGDGSRSERIGMQVEADSSGLPYIVTQPVAAESVRSVTHWSGAYLYTAVTKQLVVGSVFVGNKNGVGRTWFDGVTMYAGVPSGLKPYLLGTTPTPGAFAVGNYAFALQNTDEPTLLHVCAAFSSYLETNYFSSNPAMAPWKLFYSIYTLGAGSIATHTVDTVLLNTISSGYVYPSGVIDYVKAWEVLNQFLPWPNVNERAPDDSAMFHAPSGDVYSWTRKYGAIKFTTTGMFAATITVPTAVSVTPGVRPEMYYAGFNSYVCVCTKNSKARKYTLPAEQALYDADHNGVVAVYYGSPFFGWTQLPQPETGWRLLHVDIVKAYNGDVTLMGVMTEINSPNTYHLCVLDYANSSGSWVRLSKINTGTINPDTARWAASVFGDGKYVDDLRKFPTPPPALPQMPAAPYAEYAANLP